MKTWTAALLLLLMPGTPAFSAAPHSEDRIVGALQMFYIAGRCGIRLDPKANAWAQGVEAGATDKVNARAIYLGERTYRDKVAAEGRKKACANIKRSLQQSGLTK